MKVGKMSAKRLGHKRPGEQWQRTLPARCGADNRKTLAVLQRRLALLNHYQQRLATCSEKHLRSLFRQIAQTDLEEIHHCLSGLQKQGLISEQDDYPKAYGPANEGQTQAPSAVSHSPSVTPTQTTVISTPKTPTQEIAGKVEPGQRQVPIIAWRKVSDNLVIFKVARPPDFQFIPGQHIKLGIGSMQRRYSIVSAPHEPFLEFFVELVPAGAMSTQLRKLTVGDLLTLDKDAQGKLTVDSRFSKQLMLATVTGVNPFISILRAYLHERRYGQRFYLLHGASYQNEFGYRDELTQLADAHPEVLTYIPTISRPDELRNASWTGERGRVDAIVANYQKQLALTPDSTAFYACGHPAMVDNMEKRFTHQNYSVKVERYN